MPHARQRRISYVRVELLTSTFTRCIGDPAPPAGFFFLVYRKFTSSAIPCVRTFEYMKPVTRFRNAWDAPARFGCIASSAHVAHEAMRLLSPFMHTQLLRTASAKSSVLVTRSMESRSTGKFRTVSSLFPALVINEHRREKGQMTCQIL